MGGFILKHTRLTTREHCSAQNGEKEYIARRRSPVGVSGLQISAYQLDSSSSLINMSKKEAALK
jgi:hypothetical protein